MKREEALACVQEQLTEQRYIHTVGVMETAVQLAERFGADVKKAEIAAIFHDYAKFRPKEEMKQIILNGAGRLKCSIFIMNFGMRRQEPRLSKQRLELRMKTSCQPFDSIHLGGRI
ncbi:hypothetical protein RSC3_02879 [Bacillus paralicheniformis]|nr:hypothetical protein RSC3_02879 [Bacillus paralicheniformis]